MEIFSLKTSSSEILVGEKIFCSPKLGARSPPLLSLLHSQDLHTVECRVLLSFAEESPWIKLGDVLWISQCTYRRTIASHYDSDCRQAHYKTSCDCRSRDDCNIICIEQELVCSTL